MQRSRGRTHNNMRWEGRARPKGQKAASGRTKWKWQWKTWMGVVELVVQGWWMGCPARRPVAVAVEMLDGWVQWYVQFLQSTVGQTGVQKDNGQYSKP